MIGDTLAVLVCVQWLTEGPAEGIRPSASLKLDSATLPTSDTVVLNKCVKTTKLHICPHTPAAIFSLSKCQLSSVTILVVSNIFNMIIIVIIVIIVIVWFLIIITIAVL